LRKVWILLKGPIDQTKFSGRKSGKKLSIPRISI